MICWAGEINGLVDIQKHIHYKMQKLQSNAELLMK